MTRADDPNLRLVGPRGSLPIHEDDEVAVRFAMLIEGECEPTGPREAARKYGLSKQRYYQLRRAFLEHGTAGLVSRRPGPKTNYRRPDSVVQEVIRHRFLDPQAPPDVIAQKLRQSGHTISTRTVERIIQGAGLQKKTSTGRPRT